MSARAGVVKLIFLLLPGLARTGTAVAVSVARSVGGEMQSSLNYFFPLTSLLRDQWGSRSASTTTVWDVMRFLSLQSAQCTARCKIPSSRLLLLLACCLFPAQC
uniref:Putative secreted protein n=1 Tax=Anopheles darlingi TaxID=43151 RepID=A0A2M4DDV1_ANODA